MKFAPLLLLLIYSISARAQTSVTGSDGVEVFIHDTSRIITIGGSITETVYALGFGDHVVATDQSSTYPADVFKLPRVPYVRNLTSEGILSVGASLIIASDDASPRSAIDQLREAGTPVLLVKEEENIQGVSNKINLIGGALSAEDAAQKIVQTNNNEFEKAAKLRDDLKSNPSVLFILAVRNESSFMVAGAETGASTMIELAGATNAFSSFTGYKPISNEAILQANPDYVLVMGSRRDEIEQGLRSTPGVNLISAVQNNAIIAIDGNFLLGFGPRFGQAILALMQELHPTTELDF
jgi:iron complex transport system substrate-binding protein